MRFLTLFLLFFPSIAFSGDYNPLSVVWGGKNWTSSEDLSGKYKSEVTDEGLKIEIIVMDDQVNLNDGLIDSDHIELWLALPPNLYTDNPNGFKYLKDLNSVYWIDPKFGSDILSMSGDYQNAGPNCIWDYFDSVKFQKMNLWFGLRHLGIFPRQEKAISYEAEKSPYVNSQLLDKDIKVVTKEISNDGYRVEVIIPISSFGLIPVDGFDGFRYMIDIVDVDGDKQETLLSSSSQRKWGKPSSFNAFELKSEWNVPVLDVLDVDEMGKGYLVDHLDGYYLYDNREWKNLILGSVESVGSDLCSYGVSKWASKYEANIIKYGLKYENRVLGEFLIEKVNDVYYINGKRAFESSVSIDDIFQLSDEVLAFSALKSEPSRGLYAQGPCAGGTNTTAYVATYDGFKYREHDLIGWSGCGVGYTLSNIVKLSPVIDSDLYEKSRSDYFDFVMTYDIAHPLVRLSSRDISLNFDIENILEGEVVISVGEVYELSSLMSKISDNTRFQPVEEHEAYFYLMLEKHVGYEDYEYDCFGVYDMAVALLIRDKLKVKNACRLNAKMVINEFEKGIGLEEIKDNVIDEFFYRQESGQPYNFLFGLSVVKELAEEGVKSSNADLIDISIFYLSWVLDKNNKEIPESLRGFENTFYDILYLLIDYREDRIQEVLNNNGNSRELFKQADVYKIRSIVDFDEVVGILERHEFSDDELFELYFKNYRAQDKLLAINTVYDVDGLLASSDFKKILSAALDVVRDWDVFKSFLDEQRYFDIRDENVREYLAFESLKKTNFYPGIFDYLPKEMPMKDGVDLVDIILDARYPSPYFVGNRKSKLDLIDALVKHYKSVDLNRYLLKAAEYDFLYMKAGFDGEIFKYFLPLKADDVTDYAKGYEILDVVYRYVAREELLRLLALGMTKSTDNTVYKLFDRFHYLSDFEVVEELSKSFPEQFSKVKHGMCDRMSFASIVDGSVSDFSSLYECNPSEKFQIEKISDSEPKGDLTVVVSHSHDKRSYLIDFSKNTYTPIALGDDFVDGASISHSQEYLLMSIDGKVYLGRLKDADVKLIADEFDYPVWINEYSFWARHSKLKQYCIVYLDGSSHCGEQLSFKRASYIGADGVAVANSYGSHAITYDYAIENSYRVLVSGVYTDCPDSLSFDRHFLAISDYNGYSDGNSIIKIYDIEKKEMANVPSSANGKNCPSFSSKSNKLAYRVRGEVGFGIETYDMRTGKIERLTALE